MRRLSLARWHHTGVATFILLAAACGGAGPPPAPAEGPSDLRRTQRAAERFLDTYVQEDGRVVRHDQGGDSVSEGQAYAMLLAQVAGRPQQLGVVWEWTRETLRRPDGLLSYLTDEHGVVADPEPAADADLLAAWALLRASGPVGETLRPEGEALATAVLEHSTVTSADGRPLVAAGPWAVGLQEPLVNISYWSPSVYEELARVTGDRRWTALAGASAELAGRATRGGRRLPPDWAQLRRETLAPVPRPGGPDAAPAAYGLDAQRALVWFAVGCTREQRELAEAWGQVLPDRDDALPSLALDISGGVLDPQHFPLGLVAAAAGAHAGGRPAERDRLLDEAEALEREHPSYYGSAWVALGRALLTTSALEGC